MNMTGFLILSGDVVTGLIGSYLSSYFPKIGFFKSKNKELKKILNCS